jgi:transposase-like protein
MEERKDFAMKNQRCFSLEFKRQVVEEILSGESRPAQLCRRYDIASSVLYYWEKQYSRGNLASSTVEPTEEDYSMARTGIPYENAMMESFSNTVKHEEVNLVSSP